VKRGSASGRLRPRIWPHLLRLVTKAMPDRLLENHNYSERLNSPPLFLPHHSAVDVQRGVCVAVQVGVLIVASRLPMSISISQFIRLAVSSVPY